MIEIITQHDLEKLTTTPIFKGLSASEMNAVAEKAHIRKVSADEFFFLQGDPADEIYILRAGRVKITQINPEGQQVLMRIVGPWSLFAVIALMDLEEYPASAQAADDSQALAWSKKDLLGLVIQVPRLSLNLMHLMGNHLKEFQDRFRELATERVERRLARALLRLANQTGRKTPQGVQIDFPLSRQDLAEMTGTTLYTVSRILSQWETQQLIISGRERVVICNPHGLVHIAEDLV
jgi:CRP/FNR family transcriptional regulator, nitrogen oxide reductase regulator